MSSWYWAILSLTLFPQQTVALKPHSSFKWGDIKYVYAFGDSYTFVEGREGLANFSFIGDAIDYSFTPEQLLSNTITPNKTSSNGANWLEFVTGCFGGSPFDCDVQLWNFAFAGADISGDILPLHHDYTISLVKQVEQWVTYASNVIPHPSKETLTAWWIGINDTGDTVSNDTITDYAAFWDYELSTYFEAVQAATDHGLTQHLFVNVPPGDRSPLANTNATKAAILKERVEGFNVALDRNMDLFSLRNPHATVMTFDAHKFFNSVLDKPAEYGFTDVVGYCTCADPAGYFWYNSGHPTERVHELLGKAMLEQLESC